MASQTGDHRPAECCRELLPRGRRVPAVAASPDTPAAVACGLLPVGPRVQHEHEQRGGGSGSEAAHPPAGAHLGACVAVIERAGSRGDAQL